MPGGAGPESVSVLLNRVCGGERGEKSKEKVRSKGTADGRTDGRTHTMARRTSPVGMTPSFSPSMGSANSAKASRISCSCRAEMLCSFASFDCRSLGASLVLAFALRFGGCVDRRGGG